MSEYKDIADSIGPADHRPNTSTPSGGFTGPMAKQRERTNRTNISEAEQ